MKIREAAAQYSRFIGRIVIYHSWRAWELYRDEPGSRIPTFDDARGLYAFTGGAVRPDHFYQLEELERFGAAGGSVLAEALADKGGG